MPEEEAHPCDELDQHRAREHRAREAVRDRGTEPGQTAERDGAVQQAEQVHLVLQVRTRPPEDEAEAEPDRALEADLAVQDRIVRGTFQTCAGEGKQTHTVDDVGSPRGERDDAERPDGHLQCVHGVSPQCVG